MVYRHSSTVEHPDRANGHANGVQEALEELKIESDKGHEVVLNANTEQQVEGDGEAAQCIWLARVRPEDCENIIRYTILQGKVVKPERQLRGGFDRSKQLASW
jgi:SpoVK/Ycf46/Vps4 family AAA+-type ATPase